MPGVMQGCGKITLELDEREAMLLFGMIYEKTRGLPQGLKAHHDWRKILVQLADSLLGVYRS
ncbi:MAG: hypothetical protein DPW09_33360 [Anaerolineae bacterium]|nr:hypothetical protein [Anaerolineae bacterium]